MPSLPNDPLRTRLLAIFLHVTLLPTWRWIRLSDMQQSMRMVNRALLDSEEPVTQTVVGAPSPVHSQQSLGTETHRIHRNSTLVKKMERAQVIRTRILLPGLITGPSSDTGSITRNDS